MIQARVLPYALLLLALLPLPVWAHDMWIAPSAFHAQTGERIEVDLQLGHAGDLEILPRRERRIVRFEVLEPDGSVRIPGLDGRRPAGFLRPSAPGLHTVIYESNAAFSELGGAAFTRYLEEEGLRGALEWRRQHGEESQPGREQYSRSLKSLLVVHDAARAPLQLNDRAVGLPLELVIETPNFQRADRLRLRVLYAGRPLAGALVDARQADEDRARWSGTSDDAGMVEFASLEPGHLILSTVHMVRADAHDAEWRTIFSTLTFEILERPEVRLAANDGDR